MLLLRCSSKPFILIAAAAAAAGKLKHRGAPQRERLLETQDVLQRQLCSSTQVGCC
jgi:hypothetical protein